MAHRKLKKCALNAELRYIKGVGLNRFAVSGKSIFGDLALTNRFGTASRVGSMCGIAWQCPVCHQGRMLMIEILPRSPHRHLAPIKDTS